MMAVTTRNASKSGDDGGAILVEVFRAWGVRMRQRAE
jgi:hypothetical protein